MELDQIFTDYFLDRVASSIADKVAERLRTEPERKYVTLSELAKLTGFSKGTVARKVKAMEEATGSGTFRDSNKGLRIDLNHYYEYMEGARRR